MTLKQQVIQSRMEGHTYGEIRGMYGVPKSTAQDWVNKWSDNEEDDLPEDEEIPQGFVNDNLQKAKPARFQKSEIEVLDFLKELAPIQISPPLRKFSTRTFSNYAVILNDLHFPKHCQKSIDVALETISRLQPMMVILNGDTVDLLSVSRFPKDIRHNYTLLEERIAYHKFLDEVLEASDGAEIYETHSNHSGNGTDGRWFRYLSERLGELATLPEVVTALSYENIFLGDYKDLVKHVDYVELCPDLVVAHGDVVRKHGGYSARGVLEKYYQSMIVGHTHRMGMTAQRIPGIGSRNEKQIYVWEMGCLCDLNPIYASSPNWQNGFGIVSIGEDGTFGVEQVLVQNGRANVVALGESISVV